MIPGKQCHALMLIGARGTATAIAAKTHMDSHTAFVHFQTAMALERRGLIAISRPDEWEITLTDAGRAMLETWRNVRV